jgi:hypothetical protein
LRQDADAVRFQRVERVGDLLQTTLDVGQRKNREQTETALVIRHHLRRRELVHLASELSRFLRVAEPDPRRRDRKHGGLGADAIERFDRSRRRIILPCRESRHSADRILGAEECEKAR